ncbi:hypothetical protein KA996_02490, partial [bacterium]|nr:hypothetical protein [bacterium]
DGREIKEKGEFTVVAELMENTNETKEIDSQLLEILKKSELSNKDAAELVARIYPKLGKNEIKKIFIESKQK